MNKLKFHIFHILDVFTNILPIVDLTIKSAVYNLLEMLLILLQYYAFILLVYSDIIFYSLLEMLLTPCGRHNIMDAGRFAGIFAE